MSNYPPPYTTHYNRKSIDKITGDRSERNSSIELYRIIATFSVLIIHFNGWFVDGPPENYDMANPSLFRTAQMIISAATVICVNMFIIISGYCGIKLRIGSILKLCIYLALIFIPFYIIRSYYMHDFNACVFVEKCFVISNAGYFIQCYFMLMILSPLLNSFIDKYEKKCLKWVVVFFLLEFWFGCIMNVEGLGYNHGYSVIHFVLVYMIARCIKLYENELKKIKPKFWLLAYVLFTTIISISYIVGIKWCWDYSNPFVVISAVCTFLPFLYKSYHNAFINWIAGGTLAVYIIQVTNPVYHYLKLIDKNLLETNTYPMYLLLISAVILITFSVSVLYGIMCSRLSSWVVKRMIHGRVLSFEYQ